MPHDVWLKLIHPTQLFSSLLDQDLLFLPFFSNLSTGKGQKKDSLHDCYRLKIFQWDRREEEKLRIVSVRDKDPETVLLSHSECNLPLAIKPVLSNSTWFENQELAWFITSSWVSLRHSGETKTFPHSCNVNAHTSHCSRPLRHNLWSRAIILPLSYFYKRKRLNV